jgi:hypothetical protein
MGSLFVRHRSGNRQLHLGACAHLIPEIQIAIQFAEPARASPICPNVQVGRRRQGSLCRSPCHHRGYALEADPDHNGSPLRCGRQERARKHFGSVPIRRNPSPVCARASALPGYPSFSPHDRCASWWMSRSGLRAPAAAARDKRKVQIARVRTTFIGFPSVKTPMSPGPSSYLLRYSPGTRRWSSPRASKR